MPPLYYSSKSYPPTLSGNSSLMNKNYMEQGRDYFMPPPSRHYYRPEEMYNRRRDEIYDRRREEMYDRRREGMYNRRPEEMYNRRLEEIYDRKPDKIVGSAMDDTHKNPNKVFVGGLSIDTTTHRLRSYMRQFGKIIDVAIVHNKHTGRSRCFGFCSFADEEAVDKCMQQEHKIDGASVEIRRALPRSETAEMHSSDGDQNCKIFVGGIPLDATEAQLAEFFEQFGKIKSVAVMYDRFTHKHRGFAFVTYENAEDAERAVGEHQFMDSMIETKKAERRDAPSGSRNRHNIHLQHRSNGYYNASYMNYGGPYGYSGRHNDGRYERGPMMYDQIEGQAAPGMYEGGRRGPLNGRGNHDYGHGEYYDKSARFSSPYNAPRRGPAGGGAYRSWKHNVPGVSRTHPY